MTNHGLVLHRIASSIPKWQIAGGALTVARDQAGTYSVFSGRPAVRRWLKAAGLHGIAFDRRTDLLAAVVAHAASDAIPDLSFRRPPADLRRRPDGRGYVTVEGDYEIRRQYPPVSARTRWEVHTVRDGRREWAGTGATLREVAEWIPSHRERLSEPTSRRAFR